MSGLPLVKGYLLTKLYRPDILNTHSNVQMLQNEVVFGVYSDSGGAVLLVLSFLVGVGCFVVGKSVFVRLIAKEW